MHRRAVVVLPVLALVIGSLGQPLLPTTSTALGASCPSFTVLPVVPSAGSAEDIAVGEFDGDSHLDVGIANFGLNVVSTLTNDGAGNLYGLRNTPGGRPPDSLGQSGIATGDFDEDGRLDLVVVKLWENTLTLLVDDPPNGFGHFRPHKSFGTGNRPFDVVAADFDLDGHLDAAVANWDSGSVTVYFGDGIGDFPVTKTITVGAFPVSLAVGDLDLDGYPEIVSANGGGVTLLYGGATRSFVSRAIPISGTNYAVAVGPINGDLLPDVAVADGLSGVFHILTNQGSPLGGTAAPLSVGPAVSTGSAFGSALGGLAAGDIDGDGLTDLAVLVANENLNLPVGEPAARILIGDGKGAFAETPVVFGRAPAAIELADMNGDGVLDLVVADDVNGIYVALNTCVPTVPLDLSATGIEVVQVVQDLANSVPLIESKRTVVRGYVTSSRPFTGIRGRLVRLDSAGNEVASLQPINQSGRITVKTNPSRALLDDSFRFELPESWTHGTLRLKLEVNPNGVPHEAVIANNVFATSATFLPTRTLKVTLVDYRWKQCADSDVVLGECKTNAASLGLTPNFPESEYAQIGSYLRRKFPVANVLVKRLEVKDEEMFLGKTAKVIPGAIELNRVIALRQGHQSSDPGTIFVWLNRSFQGGVAYKLDPRYPERQWDAIAEYAGAVTHEVGHLLGRNHTNCNGTESGPEPYPYVGGKIGGPTGDTDRFFGYAMPDATVPTIEFGSVVRSTVGDEMGYCEPRWPSDFSYLRWRTEIQTRPGFVDPTGDFLLVAGTVAADGSSAVLSQVHRLPQVTTLSSAAPSTFRVRLFDASGNVLADYPFSPGAVESHHPDPNLAFNEVFNWVTGTRRVAVVDAAGTELATRAITGNPPVVGTVLQSGGSTLPASGNVSVGWSGSDPDGDALTVSVLYSIDDGASWNALARGVVGSSFVVDAATLTGTKGLATGRFRVLLSDGVQTAAADTSAFVTPGQAPTVRIASPLPGARFELGQGTTLEAVTLDAEDGVLTGTAVAWSSSLDGALGTGPLQVIRLQEGVHTLTVTATDSDGRATTATTTVSVRRDLALGSAPIANAGADLVSTEGARVTLNGSASADPDGDTLTYSWQVVGSPVESVLLENPNTPSPSFVAVDEGTYTLRLSVSDGLNTPVSDDVSVVVSNVAPVVTITSPVQGQIFSAGNVSTRAQFTDPGPIDEHTCRVNWDTVRTGLVAAGTVDEAARTCSATRALSGGVYNIEVAVDDGDGGVGAATVRAIVFDPTKRVSGFGTVATTTPNHGTATFGFHVRYLAAPNVAAVNGLSTLPAGTYAVAYSYMTFAGESAIGAAKDVTVSGAGQRIAVSTIQGIPFGVSALKFYFTAAPGNAGGFVVQRPVQNRAVAGFMISTAGDGTAARSAPTGTLGIVVRDPATKRIVATVAVFGGRTGFDWLAISGTPSDRAVFEANATFNGSPGKRIRVTAQKTSAGDVIRFEVFDPLNPAVLLLVADGKITPLPLDDDSTLGGVIFRPG